METCVNYLISIFSLFRVLNHGFIIHIYFTRFADSNIATDDVKIRSHIEYLMQIYIILVLILYSKNVASLTVFNQGRRIR